MAFSLMRSAGPRRGLPAAIVVLALAQGAVHAGYGATISRDKFGVPHVFGKTEADAAFGFGYAQAEDHLATILANYLKASGREASVNGRSSVESDTFTHLARIPETVAEKYDSLDPKPRKVVEGFAAGIAHYMKTHPDKVPPGAAPPTPQDVLTFVKYGLVQQSLSTALSEGRNLMPPPAKEKPDGAQDGETPKKPRGSNAWAVAGPKSQSGHPMLQMDQHLPYSGIAQWYEGHLCGGSLNVIGGTSIGNPFILLGHNEHIAWTSTENYPDTADVYYEKMNPENRNQYEYDGAWRSVEVRKIRLPVRQADDKVAAVERALEYTCHGPVILHTHEKLYSAKWTDMEGIDFAPQLLAIQTAGSVADFKKAMRPLGIATGNYLCADTSGGVAYLYNARVAKKSKKFNWLCPVPGWTSETEWQEIIPFEELPQASNPECGFLQNCNDPPWTVSPDCELESSDVPDGLMRSGGGRSPGPRGERATRLLEKAGKLSFEDFRALSMDNYSILMARGKDALIDAYALQSGQASPKLMEAIKLLKEWDNYLNEDNVAMTFYMMYLSELGRGYAPKGKHSMFMAMERAVEKMMKLYGRVDVKWGPNHVIERGGKSFPVGTGGAETQTLFMASSSLQNGRFICSSGSSYLMSVELSKPPKAFSVFPLGQSNDPDSPHHTDLTALYAQRKYKPVWFTREDISANKEKEYTVEAP